MAVDELTDDVKRALEPHRALIAEFSSGVISADEFETRYLAQYLADPTRWPRDVFEVLDGLFFAVDDYVGDAELRTCAGDLDARELRMCRRRAAALGPIPAMTPDLSTAILIEGLDDWVPLLSFHFAAHKWVGALTTPSMTTPSCARTLLIAGDHRL